MAGIKPVSIGWIEVLRRTLREANEDDVLGRSAKLSYYFFLGVFPLLICMIAFLGIFSSPGEQIRQELLHFLATIIPGSGYKLVQTILTEVSQSHIVSKLSFGIIFSLWSASSGMSAVMDALNVQHEVQETRSFIRKNGIAPALTIAIAVLLLAAVAIVVVGGPMAGTFSHGMLAAALRIIQWPLALSLVLLGFALIYFMAPDVKDQEWYWITPGAVAGLFLWLVASLALKAYLHFFNDYSLPYGSLGAVIVLLLWFYLTGVAVLVGAEINTVLEDAAAEAGAPDAKEKGEKAPGQAETAALGSPPRYSSSAR